MTSVSQWLNGVRKVRRRKVMRRRDFITGSIASLTAAQSLHGEEHRSLVRAAVVIGVDKPKGLPPLNAAASGAQQITNWLRSQGFEVQPFTDDQGEVGSKEITQAIRQLVDRGTLDQLIIYFSGHGFLNAYTEYWLLSGAPSDVNEAICLGESVELARESGIPSVVFISDACRSIPTDLGVSRMWGSVVFPSRSTSSSVQTEVDQFLATHPGEPAFEIHVSESVPAFQGIYTAAFLSAFQTPPSTFVRTVNGISFVPNRSLKTYLAIEVQKRAQAKSIRLRQRPDARVESDYNTYIGRVTAASPVVAAQSPPSLQDLANDELKKAGADLTESTKVTSEGELADVSDRTRFNSVRQLVVKTQELPPIEVATGLTITGTKLSAATSTSMVRTEIVDAGDGNSRPAIVRVDLGSHAAGSVALQFSDGNGTVLAALRGFIAAVLVDRGLVTNVSYLPSRSNPRWSIYQNERDRLDQLRAAVAASAKFGQFRIEGDSKTRNQMAEQLADRVRVLKGLDPTLGIYVAYAYNDAGLLYNDASLMEKVRSVWDIMRNDLEVDLFDVAMLFGSLSMSITGSTEHIVPFIPMLSQGWTLLRVKGVPIKRELADLRDHLKEALWTTFDDAGMTIALGVLRTDTNR
jgi:hypothetical protein